MKRRDKTLTMPRNSVKHRKTVRRMLRLWHVKAHELEVQIALHRIAYGTNPALYRALGDAVQRCRPHRASEIFKSAHGFLRRQRFGQKSKR